VSGRAAGGLRRPALLLGWLLTVGCQSLSGVGSLEVQGRIGAPCGADAACVSGHCVDDVCCPSACEQPCRSCNLPGSVGTCAPRPAGDDPAGGCGTGMSCNGHGSCFELDPLWAVTLPRPNLDEEPGGLSVDASGNVTTTGIWYQEGGSTDMDVFIAKLDRHGNPSWSGTLGGPFRQLGEHVAHDLHDGATYVAGPFAGTLDFGVPPFDATGAPPLASPCTAGSAPIPCCAFLARLTGDGRYDWSTAIGHESSCVTLGAMASLGPDLDPSAGVVLAGTLAGAVDVGTVPVGSTADSEDVLVARIDAAGSALWASAFGDGAAQGGSAVAVDPRPEAARLVVAGIYQGDLDLGGGPLPTVGETNLFVAAFSLGGAPLWSRGFPATGAIHAAAVSVDEVGNVVVAGDLAGSLDLGVAGLLTTDDQGIFVVQLSPAGEPAWSRQLTAAGWLSAIAMVHDPAAGTTILGGDFSADVDLGGGTFSPVGRDTYLLALGPDGGHRWSVQLGGADNEYLRGLALDGDGNVVVGGELNGELAVGDTILSTGNSKDVFVTKLAIH